MWLALKKHENLLRVGASAAPTQLLPRLLVLLRSNLFSFEARALLPL